MCVDAGGAVAAVIVGLSLPFFFLSYSHTTNTPPPPPKPNTTKQQQQELATVIRSLGSLGHTPSPLFLAALADGCLMDRRGLEGLDASVPLLYEF